MSKLRALRLESLEARDVPALFGNAWANPLNVTLSFVPDGTSVDNQSSVLFQTLQSAGSVSAWQREVLRAAQAWAQSGLANVGVVADFGQPLGAAGAGQSDNRFGDIRIAAAPLGPDVLAITTPTAPGDGTRAGDIVLNSNKPFSLNGAAGTYHLYSVLLQEVAHAFGLGNSDDIASPRYEEYQGVRTGLTTGDLEDFRQIYGVRSADAYEGNGNGTATTARPVAIPLVNLGLIQVAGTAVIAADMQSAADVDFYKFVAPVGLDTNMTMRLATSGISLAGARLTVYAPNRTTVLGSSVAPAGGAAIGVGINFMPGSTYYVKVESSDAAFAAGAYQLRFVFNENAPDFVEAQSDQRAVNDPHTNDWLNTPTTLTTPAGYAANQRYRTLATLPDTLDADVYRVRVPQAASGEKVSIAINAIAATNGLQPQAELFDRNGNPVAATVLANGRGGYTLWAGDVEPGFDYLVRVTASASGMTRVGDYYLDVGFNSRPVELVEVASDTLTAAQPVAYRTLDIIQSQLLQLELSTASVGAPAGAKLRMTIFDAQGYAVFTQLVEVGQTLSASTYLSAGTYTIRFTSSHASVSFSLKAATISDPIGTQRGDPNQAPPTTAPPPQWSQESQGAYTTRTYYESAGASQW